MYASAAKNEPATSPRMSTTLGRPRPARSVRFGSRGSTATAITTSAPSATGHPIEGVMSAEKPMSTASTATTTASSRRVTTTRRFWGSP